MSTNLPIYLDYNATTPVAPEVCDAMLQFLREQFGNPSSAHPNGLLAARAMAEARDEVAALIGAHAGEVVFTGCAAEANNLALLGVAQVLEGNRTHLVVSAVEHPAVMAPARQLEAQGWSLTVVPVDGHGRVSPEDVARALRPDTALVSVMTPTTRSAPSSLWPRSQRSRGPAASCCTPTPRSRRGRSR